MAQCNLAVTMRMMMTKIVMSICDISPLVWRDPHHLECREERRATVGRGVQMKTQRMQGLEHRRRERTDGDAQTQVVWEA